MFYIPKVLAGWRLLQCCDAFSNRNEMTPPGTGSMVRGIRNLSIEFWKIFFFEINVVFLQKLNIFIKIGLPGMMFLLVHDVPDNIIDLRPAVRESAKTFLPPEYITAEAVLINETV